MKSTVFKVKLLDSVRSLQPPQIITSGFRSGNDTHLYAQAIASMDLWLNDTLNEAYKDDNENFHSDLDQSVKLRLAEFHELAIKRNLSKINNLTQEERDRAFEILVSLHNDYYQHDVDYKNIVDIVARPISE